MPAVKVLPDQVINQIAAGEVVERPASVLRELLDNSIDAGASEITVRLERGGIALVGVTDNGVGLGKDDAITAFERHATSKISSEADLSAITSLGFRGEALPSIASIAKVSLRTREDTSDLGTEIIIEGGKLKNVSPTACPKGSDFEVRGIFFNTPARRKFLKSPETEEARCETLLMQYALAHPHLKLSLVCEGKEKLHLRKAKSSSERMKLWLRGSVAEVRFSSDLVAVTGLIGHPAASASTAGSLVLIVNGRIVKDRLLFKAVREGFGFTLKSQEFPLGLISVSLPPELVDVNVHPQKSEVRFKSPQMVFHAVEQAVRQALGALKGAVGRTVAAQDHLAFTPQPISASTPVYQPQSYLHVRSEPAPNLYSQTAAKLSAVNTFEFCSLKYLAQLLECYLLCEANERFYLVDMHAAHERYNFNLVRNKLFSNPLPSQGLLTPLVLTLSPEERSYLLGHLDILHRFGFELEDFGGNSIALRAVPSIISSSRAEKVLREIAALSLTAIAEGRISRELDSVAATIACHGSIRSGRKMEREEVYALFESLDSTEFSAACPHGRPVVVSFSEFEVEKWFGRDR